MSNSTPFTRCRPFSPWYQASTSAAKKATVSSTVAERKKVRDQSKFWNGEKLVCARPDLPVSSTVDFCRRGRYYNSQHDQNRRPPMPEKNLSLAKAKATLSEQIRAVEQGEPVIITRHGKPVAALVRPELLEQLQRLRAAGPEAGLASVAGGWEEAEELVYVLESSPRTGQRDSGGLDSTCSPRPPS
jgi:prevent-host-death family protein